MNAKNLEKTSENKKRISPAKECAFLAVAVAMILVAQLAFSAVAGVEIVTVLFVAYAFIFGVKLGMAVASVFSVLRQLLFGFFLNVLILYLLYYNILCALFGWLGKRVKLNWKGLLFTVASACVCTAFFSLLDCVITPVYLGYSALAMKGYFLACLPVMCVQMFNAVITVSILFLPLTRAFLLVKRAFL